MVTELTQDDDALLTAGELKAIFRFSSSTTLHNWMRRRGFPRPVFFGRQVRRWKASEVRAWVGQATENRPAPLPKSEHAGTKRANGRTKTAAPMEKEEKAGILTKTWPKDFILTAESKLEYVAIEEWDTHNCEG